MTACTKCGLPSPNGQKICLPCWKKQRGYTLTKSDQAFIDLQHEVAGAAGGQDPAGGYDTLDAIAPLPAPEIPPDRIKGLLLLCHPDRHPPERQEAAHEATSWLLSQRSKR